LTWTKVAESVCAGVRRDEDEHRRTHHHPGARVHDEHAGHTPDSALAELCRRLESGLARAQLNQTQLAAQARLGRTNVSETLSPKKLVPSTETVGALARVLKLPVGELLELRRTAGQEPGTITADGPGQPIGQ
jgi:hypothetical protein